MKGRCALCDRAAPLLRSHIIPEHLYSHLYSLESGVRILNQISGDVTDPESNSVKWLQKGIWERLLCERCEQHINDDGEKYAAVNFIAHPTRLENSTEILYKGLDYKSMKLYFMSILWRMARSEDAMFSLISLSRSTERNLRRAILSSLPGDENFFPCFVAEDVSPHLKNLIWQPRVLLERGFGNTRVPMVELLANGQRWMIQAHPEARIPRTGQWNSGMCRDGTLRVPKFDMRKTEMGQDIYRKVMAIPESIEKKIR